MAEMEIISPGFYTSIQDLGRFDVAKYGVPQAGAMDAFSAKKANLLLNNDPNDALLEITFSGPKIKFSHAATICICGAKFKVECNGHKLENDRPYTLNAGDQVNFGALLKGFRAYLAISGGIYISPISSENCFLIASCDGGEFVWRYIVLLFEDIDWWEID